LANIGNLTPIVKAAEALDLGLIARFLVTGVISILA